MWSILLSKARLAREIAELKADAARLKKRNLRLYQTQPTEKLISELSRWRLASIKDAQTIDGLNVRILQLSEQIHDQYTAALATNVLKAVGVLPDDRDTVDYKAEHARLSKELQL